MSGSSDTILAITVHVAFGAVPQKSHGSTHDKRIHSEKEDMLMDLRP